MEEFKCPVCGCLLDIQFVPKENNDGKGDGYQATCNLCGISNDELEPCAADAVAALRKKMDEWRKRENGATEKLYANPHARHTVREIVHNESLDKPKEFCWFSDDYEMVKNYFESRQVNETKAVYLDGYDVSLAFADKVIKGWEDILMREEEERKAKLP